MVWLMVGVAVVALVAWFWVAMFRDLDSNSGLSAPARKNWFLGFLSMNLFVAIAYWVAEYRRRHW